MEFMKRSPSGGSLLLRSDISNYAIQCAKFDLIKLVVVWLLGLLTAIILVPIVAILVMMGRIGPAIGIGTLIGGTLTCVGKLLNNTLKPILRIEQ